MATETLATVTETLRGTLSATNLADKKSQPQEEVNIDTYFALLLSVALLYLILIISYFFLRKKIRVIHETVISIILGISFIVWALLFDLGSIIPSCLVWPLLFDLGSIIPSCSICSVNLIYMCIYRMIIGSVLSSYNNRSIMKLVSFDIRYFFNLLLPPIILNSGYDMHRQNFFKHFGTILTFALGGTFISTLFIGTCFYTFLSISFYNLQLSFLDCVIIGSILSSTDPVTILSLFHQLGVDPKLYAIIFGESLLNDSVAIVLFSTLGKLRGKELSLLNVLYGIGSFAGVFSGSLLIGVVAGLSCALLLKCTKLDKYPSLETCLVVLQAYSSYLLSNALKFSGIVSLLFCGITMKHYAYDNMSLESKHTTKSMFRVLSQLSENFVFIYLGMTLFTATDLVFLPVLICFALIIIMVARFVSVVPLARLINRIHLWKYPNDSSKQIPENHQYMIWWAGLRGAIAFALSYDVEGANSKAVQTTILVVCVISIVVLGGTTPFALRYLNIKTGCTISGQKNVENYEDGIELGDATPLHFGSLELGRSSGELESTADFSQFDNEDLSKLAQEIISRHEDSEHWFLKFDNAYLKPFFTRQSSTDLRNEEYLHALIKK